MSPTDDMLRLLLGKSAEFLRIQKLLLSILNKNKEFNLYSNLKPWISVVIRMNWIRNKSHILHIINYSYTVHLFWHLANTF